MDEVITGAEMELRRWMPSDREALAEIVTSSLPHIATYMPQAATELADPAAFLALASRLWAAGSVFAYSIVRAGRVVGHITLTPERSGAVVGYWVRSEDVGLGYATAAIGVLADAVFCSTDIIELRADCNVANAASARVLAKAGFRLAGRRSWQPRTEAEAPEELLWVLDRY